MGAARWKTLRDPLNYESKASVVWISKTKLDDFYHSADMYPGLLLEEGRRTYRQKRCEYNSKDEDNSLKTLNDKNKASS